MTETNQPVPASPAAPHESLVHRIEDFFHHTEQTAEQEFLDAWHQFEPAALGLLKTSLGQIAKVAVTNAEALLTNEEKTGAAAAAIAAAAEQAGIAAKNSLVNLLREIALQDLKGTLSSVTPVAPVQISKE